MSLSGALSNAMSGLTANARGTSVVSANIANALNESYGRREINLSTNANQSSGGVRVAQISRFSDPILAYQKRLASADTSQKQTLASFSADLEQLWGSVDTVGSVAQKLTGFETALLSAASDPSSATRLRSVAYAADDFAASIRAASDGLQIRRTQADAEIASAVDTINAGLSQLEAFNTQIMTAKHLGQDTLGLIDNRDAVLDQLAEYVPINVVERDSGEIAIFTAKGRTLLDVNAVQLSFEKQPLVLAHMTADNGLLSELQINGDIVDSSAKGMMSGGRLAALFEIRDDAAPNAQSQLDAIAREMIDRFGSGGPDTTLAVGDLGIFTDEGLVFSPANETGLASRIALNATLNPTSPDQWRWRDGINAASEGEAGASELILGLRAQITTALAPGSATLGSSPQTLVGHIQSLTNDIATERVRSSDAFEFASTQFETLRHAKAENGVNTDQELQKLISLEKSYAANARVVQVVDDMLSELLNI